MCVCVFYLFFQHIFGIPITKTPPYSRGKWRKNHLHHLNSVYEIVTFSRQQLKCYICQISVARYSTSSDFFFVSCHNSTTTHVLLTLWTIAQNAAPLLLFCNVQRRLKRLDILKLDRCIVIKHLHTTVRFFFFAFFPMRFSNSLHFNKSNQ